MPFGGKAEEIKGPQAWRVTLRGLFFDNAAAVRHAQPQYIFFGNSPLFRSSLPEAAAPRVWIDNRLI